MSKYMSLEHTIRKLGAKTASQPMEKDMNDQVHAGSYSSKHFEVSAPAQKLYAALPKEVNPDDAEKSVQLHDKLFAIHKKTAATERSTSSDVKDAQRLHNEIMKLAKDMGLENKHGHVKDSLEHIKKYVDTQVDPKDEITPEDVAKRFAATPKDYQTDVKADSDIDNIARFRITRDKKGQRKLKIIDDEYNLGATRMDRIENVSPSFLEALKQVQENENELLEKKKMTKADIAALKEPKGSIDANDLAALRAGEHKKKKVEEAKAMHNYTPEGINCPVCGMKACPPKSKSVEEGVIKDALKGAAKETLSKYGTLGKALAKKMDSKKTNEEVEELNEAQFIVIQKGMDKKRIRNNPVEIMRARKDGWAIREEVESLDELTGYKKKKLFGKDPLTAVANRAINRMKLPPNDGGKLSPKDRASNEKNRKVSQMAFDRMEEEVETVDEANELKSLAKSQASATVKREVGQKKAMFAKKDAVDKQKFSKSMQNIKAGDEVKMGGERLEEDEMYKGFMRTVHSHAKTMTPKKFAKEYPSMANHQDTIRKTPLKDVHRLKVDKDGKPFMYMNNEEFDYLDEVLDTDEKKMAYAKKASDQIKSHIERGGSYDTSPQGEKDAKGVEKRTRGLQSLVKKIQKKTAQESFMERAIAILGEEYADLSFEELVEEVKRARGRPRKNPPKDPNAPKRPRGRPKKGSSPASTSSSSAASTADTDKDREHIVMALRKSISSRGQHHVKFADGNSHQVPAEHAQKALKMHDSLNRPSEKMVFARKLAASHSSFKKALDDKNPGSEETKKTGITLAKRAD